MKIKLFMQCIYDEKMLVISEIQEGGPYMFVTSGIQEEGL